MITADEIANEVWRKWPREIKWKHKISSLGRIKRYYKTYDEWRIRQPTVYKERNGARRRKYKDALVARIVGEAFLPQYAGEGKFHIDHINRDSFDDRASNLRWLSPLSNAQNKLGEKGYWFCKKTKQYIPSIRVNNVQYHLPSCKTEKEARQSYLRAKKQYHPSCTITEKILPGPKHVLFEDVVDLKDEVWKPVPCKKCPVMVSNKGRLKRKWKIGCRLASLKPTMNGRVIACIDGKSRLLHALIATAFVANPNNYKYVRHVDGNFSNNVPENLVWMSASEKSKRAYGKL